MTYDFYPLFNLTDFLATGLVSRKLSVALEDIGQEDVYIFRGNEVSILFRDTFLPVQFAGKNPYWRSPYGVFRDTDDWIYLGVEVP